MWRFEVFSRDWDGNGYQPAFGLTMVDLLSFCHQSMKQSYLSTVQTPKPWLRVSDGWLTILTAG